MGRIDARFGRILAGILLASSCVRVAYVAVRAASDPTFDYHTLDSAYYLEWARALVAGEPPEGAFYLAPLYPYFLALFISSFGENFFLLYCVQQGFVLGAAALLALAGRRLVDGPTGLFAAVLLLLYHPLLFFPARVIGEPLAVFLLCFSLYCISRPSLFAAGAAGGLIGLAAIGRPNLLLVPAAWAAALLWQRRLPRAALLAASVALTLVPTAVHNTLASGHFVLVSSNGGLTLYVGNAPGADVRGTQRPPGTSGAVASVREESTLVARQLSGLPLDAVEADAWWGRRAVEARLEDPKGTARLLLRRASLLVSNAELSLDLAPAMDPSPLRWSAPYPACLLFGFAVGGVVALGWRRTGGFPVWLAITACAATPLLFYVSSRYRLPTMALLCLPAGAGLRALASGAPGLAARRKRLGLLFGLLATAASLLVPVGEGRQGDVQFLLERSLAYRAKGELASAEAEIRTALDRDRRSTRAWTALGDLLIVAGRPAEAEEALARALEIRPRLSNVAGALGDLLLEQGRPVEAIPLLEQFVDGYPSHVAGWNNLIHALLRAGDVQKARLALEVATRRGISLDPEIAEAPELEGATREAD